MQRSLFHMLAVKQVICREVDRHSAPSDSHSLWSRLCHGLTRAEIHASQKFTLVHVWNLGTLVQMSHRRMTKTP